MSGINAASSVGNSANSLQSMLQGRGGVTDSRTIHFGANESKEDRMRRIEEITKGNPNVKLDPEAFQKLMRGGDVDVTLNLEAPDRRNLYIGAFASLAQLAGGMGGAAYNDALGSAVVNRLGGDAEYVAKHGNNYKMGLFGGASAQNGNIQVADAKPREIINPLVNNENIDTNNTNQKLLAASATNATTQISAKGRRTPMAKAEDAVYQENFGYKRQEDGAISTEAGMTGNNIARSILNDQFGKNNVDQGGIKTNKDGKSREVIAAILVYGKKGENYLNGVDLNGNGKTVAQNNETIQARRQAVKDYLQLGVSSGLITQKDFDAAGNDPEKLKNTFKKLEGKLKAKYGDTSSTVQDGFLGDHHIMAMQKAISDKIQFNQGGAVAINAVVNGDDTKALTTDQKKAAVEFFQKANPDFFKGVTGDKFEFLAGKINSGDKTALSTASNALDSIERSQKDILFGKDGDTNSIKGGLLGVANGAFARHNTVLAQNINSTGLVDTSQLSKKVQTSLDKGGVVPQLKSDNEKLKGTSFTQQIRDLKGLIQDKINGTGGATTTTQATGLIDAEIGGKKLKGASVVDLDKELKTTSSPINKASKDALLGTVSENIAGQLKTAGIKGKDGGEITAAQVQDFITKGGAGFPKDKQDKIDANPTLKAIFDGSAGTGATSKIQDDLRASVSIAARLQKSSIDPVIQNKTTTNIKDVDNFLSRAGNNTATQLDKANKATASIKNDLNDQITSLLEQNGTSQADIDKFKTQGKGGLIDSKEALDQLKATVPADQLAKLTSNITAFKALETRVSSTTAVANSGAVGEARAAATNTAAKPDTAAQTTAKVAQTIQQPTGNGNKAEGKANGKTPEELARIQAAAGGGGNQQKPEATATGKPTDDLLEKFLDIGTKAGDPEKPKEKGKIQAAIDELLKATSNISKTYFQITDEILSRLNKEAAGSFEYGFGHGNEGRITANIGGVADRDKDAQGNTLQTAKTFQNGNEVAERTKAAFDTLTRYGKNREDEAREGRVSVGEGLERYNKNIDRYIEANPQETKKAQAYKVTSTPEAKAEAAKYTATGGTSLTDGFVSFAKAVGATKGSGIEQDTSKKKNEEVSSGSSTST